ncbi:hypothetical protein K3495_g313 [Podosphaera aphanis]|nr:hypothetical protein K3495_g313 [Podosphaera aphanis]
MVVRILHNNSDYEPLGKNWLQKFMSRNPQVATCIGRKIEASRIDGTHPDLISEFYTRFQEMQRRYGIRQQNIWNTDEHGIALGVCINSLVLASSTKKCTYVKSPESREWVSIIETVSATGSYIRPLIIFKGNNPQNTWFPEVTPEWYFTTSENGWTNNFIALQWLKNIFIPETRPQTSDHRLLIMDGHGSHTSPEFLLLCKQNNIQLLFLPAHSSHVLQPLALGVFAPLKSRYRTQIAEHAHLHDAATVKKQRFVSCYHLARMDTFNPRVLRSGWKAAGLLPWDPKKGLNFSQVPKPKQHPLTPSQTTDSTLDDSPRSSSQVYQVIQQVRDPKSPDSPRKKFLKRKFQETGRVLDSLNTRLALLEEKNLQLESRASSNSNKRRKRVQHDPNTRFANIDSTVTNLENQGLQGS